MFRKDPKSGDLVEVKSAGGKVTVTQVGGGNIFKVVSVGGTVTSF